MKKYECVTCGYIYDPELGDPDSGIEPGTAFEDIPEDWVCPLCGVGKDDTKEIKKVLNGSNNLLVLDNSDEFDLDNKKKYHIATYPSDNTLKAEKILKYSKNFL